MDFIVPSRLRGVRAHELEERFVGGVDGDLVVPFYLDGDAVCDDGAESGVGAQGLEMMLRGDGEHGLFVVGLA